MNDEPSGSRLAAASERDPRQVTALIVDDEPLALRRLRSLLSEVPWLTLIGEATNGTEAIDANDSLKPDLLFLDIVMPEKNGLEVLQSIRHRPTVIFTTAFDRYAVAAFEAQALDYLIKPFGRDRLMATLERARLSLDDTPTVVSVERGKVALDHSKQSEWLFVRSHGKVTPINVRQVSRFEGADDYVTIHTESRRLLAMLRLSDLERMLPADFVRIHRSHIVNLTMVESFLTESGGRYTVVLRDGTRLAVSRERARWLRERAI